MSRGFLFPYKLCRETNILLLRHRTKGRKQYATTFLRLGSFVLSVLCCRNRVCYGCGKNGHTRRFCKRAEDNEGDLLDKYIQDIQASTISVSNAVHSTSATELKTASLVLQTEQVFLDELCEALDAESPVDMEPDQTRKLDGP